MLSYIIVVVQDINGDTNRSGQKAVPFHAKMIKIDIDIDINTH